MGKIAAVLGVSIGKLRGEYLERPGFPAKKAGPGGHWITTRQSLAAWAESYVCQDLG